MKKWIRKIQVKKRLDVSVHLQREKTLVKNCKKLASLCDELKRRNEYLDRTLDEYRRYNVIPKSTFAKLADIIPDPTQFMGAPHYYKLDTVALIDIKGVMRYKITIQLRKIGSYLSINIPELSIRTSVECVLHEDDYSFYGLSTRVRVYHWNWSKAGLTIISDTDFYIISEYLKAAPEANKMIREMLS